MPTKITATIVRPNIDVQFYPGTEEARSNQDFQNHVQITQQLISSGVISVVNVNVDPVTIRNETTVYDMTAYLAAFNVQSTSEIQIAGLGEYNLEHGIIVTVVEEEIS